MIVNHHYPTSVNQYNRPASEGRTVNSDSGAKDEPKVTWEQYFQNYQKDNFEEEYGVKKGDLEGFAEKNNLRITIEQYLQYIRNDDYEEDIGVKKHDFEGFAEKYNLKYTRLPSVTYEDIMVGNDIFSRFTVRADKGFNKSENSISLVPGVDIDLGNGIVLKITDSKVEMHYDERTITEEKFRKAGQIAAALNKFIRYANGQNGSFGFDSEQRKLVETALKKLGIDTSREFIVNGTAFTTTGNVNGTLEKVDYDHRYAMLPAHMWEEVLNRYDANSKWA